jgi:hypothetical protein
MRKFYQKIFIKKLSNFIKKFIKFHYKIIKIHQISSKKLSLLFSLDGEPEIWPKRKSVFHPRDFRRRRSGHFALELDARALGHRQGGPQLRHLRGRS